MEMPRGKVESISEHREFVFDSFALFTFSAGFTGGSGLSFSEN